jgi:putative glutamine amidotransferase
MAPLIGISTGFTDYGDYLGIAFSRPLERLGAFVAVVPYLRRPSGLLSHLDGVMLGVGRDLEPARFGGCSDQSSTLHSPLRDETEFRLAQAAISAGVPMLGVCRGMQVISVALGGTLHHDHSALAAPADEHPGGDWERWEQVVRARLEDAAAPAHPEHEIAITAGSLLSVALGTSATVNSYHHQSIATLGEGVEVTAVAPDGVIEAIEVPTARAMCLGVQWELQEQPESPVFELLVERAASYAGQRAQHASESQKSPRELDRSTSQSGACDAMTHCL